MPTQDNASLRNFRARVASISALIARIVAISVSFAIIPMTQDYLGAERFGLWVTVTSFVTMLSFADFGISNAILSGIAHANSVKNYEKVNEIVSTAAFVLLSLGVAFALIGNCVVAVVNFTALFNVNESSIQTELSQSLRVFALMFGLNLSVAWISRVQIAFQKSYLESVSTVLGALLSLGWVAFSIQKNFELPILLAGFMASPIIGIVLVGAYFLKSEHYLKFPKISFFSKKSVQIILSGGFLFVALQASGAAAFASDSFILTAQLGPSESGEFAIVAKLYSAILLLANVYVTPLWPAYAEAHANGERAWIKKAVQKSFVVCALGATIAGVFLTICYKLVTSFWLGAAQQISMSVLIMMSVLMVFVSIGSAGSMFLNGLQIYRFQLICALTFIIIMLPAKWFLVPVWGVSAIPIVGSIAFAITHILPYSWFIPRQWSKDAL